MKNRWMERKTLLQVVLVVAVVGGLLYRDYRIAGLVVTLCGIGVYMLANTRRAVRFALHLRQTTGRQRLKLLTYLLLLYIFVSAVATHTVYYFLLLLVLGIDYFLYTGRPSQSSQSEK